MLGIAMLGVLSLILVVGIALLHIFIMLVEMFFWDKKLGMKMFGNNPERAKLTKVMAQNQGLYNGFLAAGLLWALALLSMERYEFAVAVAHFFLICIAIAGLYGGYTVSRKIIMVQTVPAVLALLLINLFLRTGAVGF